MKLYNEKFMRLVKRYGWACPIAAENGDIAQVSELHHIVHNTKMNRRLYPLLIDSVINLRPVSHGWHLARPSWGCMSDYRAARREAFLSRHPRIAEYVNNL